MSGEVLAFDTTAFGKAAKVLDAYPKELARAVRPLVSQQLNVVRKHVRAELKPHRRTGKMSSNVRTRIKGTGMNLQGQVRATGSGGNLLVGGVKPHTIAPGRVMPIWEGRGAWRGGSGRGITGFTELSQHPGYKGDPFFHRGVMRSMGELEAINQRAADDMAHELAKRLSR